MNWASSTTSISGNHSHRCRLSVSLAVIGVRRCPALSIRVGPVLASLRRAPLHPTCHPYFREERTISRAASLRITPSTILQSTSIPRHSLSNPRNPVLYYFYFSIFPPGPIFSTLQSGLTQFFLLNGVPHCLTGSAFLAVRVITTTSSIFVSLPREPGTHYYRTKGASCSSRAHPQPWTLSLNVHFRIATCRKVTPSKASSPCRLYHNSPTVSPRLNTAQHSLGSTQKQVKFEIRVTGLSPQANVSIHDICQLHVVNTHSRFIQCVSAHGLTVANTTQPF